MSDQERESPIPLSVDLESASSIADELLREHPPYDGPHDSNPTVEENAARLLRRLVKRLTPVEPTAQKRTARPVSSEEAESDG